MYSIDKMKQQGRNLQPATEQRPTFLFIRYLVCGVVALFVLVPIVATVIDGFKTDGEIAGEPFSLPSVWHWETYGAILSQSSFWQALSNSAISTIATVGLLLAVACPSAFVFARLSFRGREVLFSTLLFGLLFPVSMAILPLYVTLRNLQMVNSLVGVILPQVAFALPTTVLILRNFFLAIPRELEDATYLDGGSVIDFFWRIMLPLSRPALAVVSMLAMVTSWNNFLLPLLVLNDSSLWTVPLGMMQFQGEHATDWASTLAYVSLTMIPAIIFYLFAERHLVTGLTAGAVKG